MTGSAVECPTGVTLAVLRVLLISFGMLSGLAVAGWQLWPSTEPVPPASVCSEEPSAQPAVLTPTDLTRWGLRVTLDLPAESRIEPIPYGVAVSLPDGSRLTIEPPAMSRDADMAQQLGHRSAELLDEEPDGFVVRVGRETHFRKDVSVGSQGISVSGTGSGWASARTLRQTPEQIAAEPIRAAAWAELVHEGVRLTAETGRGVTVRFPGRDPVTDASLARLPRIPDVTALEIAEGAALTAAGFDVLRQLPHLRRLDLRGPWVTPSLLSRLADLPHLEELSLHRTAVGDEGFAVISRWPALQSLTVSREPTGSGAVITGSGLKHLSGLPKLQHLRLAGQPVTDAGLSGLPALPELRSLDLSHARITDAGLSALAPLTSLESLDLTKTRVTGPGLSHLAGASRLTSVTLAYTDMTDLGLALLAGLPIVSLDLTATRITDAGVAKLPELPDLAFVDLSQTLVTDVGIPPLAALRNLTSLSLRHTAVTGSHLGRLAECPNLTALDLTGCPCGGEALDAVLALPRLNRLRVADTRITESSLRTALDRWPPHRERPRVIGPDPPRPEPPPTSTTPPALDRPPDFAAMIRRTNAYIVFADDAPGQPIIGVGLAGETVTDTDLADLRGQVTLRSLAIRSNRVTDAGLAYLAGLTNLEELILTSSRIVGDGLVHLRGLTRLRKLTLPSHPLPSRALAHLSGLNRLEDLDMADGGSAAITLYAMLPNLRRIDVGRVGNAELLRLATLSTVTDLRFQTATEKVDAWGLAGLAGMTGLRQLRIDGGIDDHGLAELIRRADTLESLEVTHAIALTDDGVKALAELLLLRRLALPGSRISNAGLARLAAASRLTDLDLSGSRVTDAGLSVLRPSRLRRLNLADTDLTDAALPHLAELPNLEWVSVRGTRITPSGLATLRAAAPGLATDPPPPRSRTEAE